MICIEITLSLFYFTAYIKLRRTCVYRNNIIEKNEGENGFSICGIFFRVYILSSFLSQLLFCWTIFLLISIEHSLYTTQYSVYDFPMNINVSLYGGKIVSSEYCFSHFITTATKTTERLSSFYFTYLKIQ